MVDIHRADKLAKVAHPRLKCGSCGDWIPSNRFPLAGACLHTRTGAHKAPIRFADVSALVCIDCCEYYCARRVKAQKKASTALEERLASLPPETKRDAAGKFILQCSSCGDRKRLVDKQGRDRFPLKCLFSPDTHLARTYLPGNNNVCLECCEFHCARLHNKTA